MMGPIVLTVSGSVGASTVIQLDYLKFGGLAVQTVASSTTSVYAVEVSLDAPSTIGSSVMTWTSLGTSTSVGNNIVTTQAPYRSLRLNVTTGASQAVTTMTVIQSAV